MIPKRPILPAAFTPFANRSMPGQPHQAVQMRDNPPVAAKAPQLPRVPLPAIQMKALTVVGAGIIQRASYASGVLEEAKDAGARLKSKEDEWIDLEVVKRSHFSWFSKRILGELGVAAKPKDGSICPMCGNPGSSFELDHMTPWRHYIAAFMHKGYVKNGLIRGDAAKALYNDSENLWWICRKCNGPKSDTIPETADHARGDFSSGTKGRTVPLPDTF